MYKLYNGDCLEVLKTLPDKSIDSCITSPPYWCLRDYGVDGQLGLEPTIEEYIDKLCNIFDEVNRVLKQTGTLWVNIGDTYSGAKVGNTETNKNPNVVTNNFKKPKINIPNKCLCQIPSRFAIEMCNRGWILRNELIWHKPNNMPQSVKDRFTVDFEKIFFFTKNQKYYFEQQLEEYKTTPTEKTRYRDKSSEKYKDTNLFSKGERDYYAMGGRNKRAVWSINTKPFKEAHFAVYPEELITPMILAGTPEYYCKQCGSIREKIFDRKRIARNELPKDDIRYRPNTYNSEYGKINGKSDAGYTDIKHIGYTKCNCENIEYLNGVVLDPFMGSGTTGVACMKHNRQFIGIELNEKYYKMSEERIRIIKEQNEIDNVFKKVE